MHHRIRKIRSYRRIRRLNFLNCFRRDEQGVQLVEVAIVVPLLLMLFAATAEFGLYFYKYTTVSKAARIGARYLTSATVKASEDAKARNLVVYGNTAGTGDPVLTGLNTSHVVIKRQGGVPLLPETVTVEIVGYKYQPVFDLGKILKSKTLSLNIDVKPSVTMRYLITQPSI